MSDLTREKEFWQVASTFPPDKEIVYPAHRQAQEFDKWEQATVLEYGCGGGADACSYLRRGCTVWATDIVAANVEMTTARARAAQLDGQLNAILLADSTVLPIEAASVDVASSHGVLHHIRDPRPVLREIRRVLKPAGRLYVMLYTEKLFDDLKEQTRTFAVNNKISWQEAFGWATDGPGCPWAVPYTEGQGRLLLKETGFSVTSTFDYNNGQFRTFRAIKC